MILSARAIIVRVDREDRFYVPQLILLGALKKINK